MPFLTSQQALDLAIQHHQAGRFPEAEALYRRLLAVEPNNSRALHLLGTIAQRSGWAEHAADLIRRAIAADPSSAAACNDLGNVLLDRGLLSEAIEAFQRAVAIDPGMAFAYNNLGNALKATGEFEQAEAAFEEALKLEPNCAEFHNNLGAALQDWDRCEESIQAFRKSIALKPNDAVAHNNLGNVLLANKQIDEAIREFEQALALQPNFALARNNLGNAFKRNYQLDDAIDAYRQALDLDPHLVLALGNLAVGLQNRGEVDEAIDIHRRALASPQCKPNIHSSYLAALQYTPQTTLAALFEAHCEYDRRHTAQFRESWQPHANLRDPSRRLRVGFVSPHFGLHPVGYFLVRLFENIDRTELEVFCYANSPRNDAMTARLRACADRWEEVTGLFDEPLARKIRRDEIDILFDLAGHTAGNRLPVFARKPAPIQITWLDYVGTTGLAAMDYILADSRQIPPEAESYYREKVLRMPDDYITFDAPSEELPVGPLPAAANGYITFGSFNAADKTTPATIALWSQVLRQVPNSRMVLRNPGFDSPAARARFGKLFADEGIAPGRISLLGAMAHLELLAAYGEVDVALDTLPYVGGLTTCEALWMGVPVITCPGEMFASRHGLAHLTAAGVTETIARDIGDYVKTAVSLANDLPRLAALRAGLRERVAASPLCDGLRFARNFECLMREMWQRWCAENRA